MPTPIPVATYRLQLTKEFGFDAAAELVPYLGALGISHLYASPFLKARSGSTHGYDVVDYGALNPELGGEVAFARLTRALQAADIGLILDFVPNHMGVNFADNSWWLDVLEWGPRSPRAASFDIAWGRLPRQRGGVLLPLLGSFYRQALESGEITLKYDARNGTFSAWYHEHRLPIDPRRYSDILQSVVVAAGAKSEPAGRRILDLAARYRGPASPTYEQASTLKADLASIESGADIIERGLESYRSSPDNPEATHRLHCLLERQHYRLTHWRRAPTDTNYRRFFDINDLAGLRMEDAGTFQEAHALVARLIAEEKLNGLRLDHIDGLSDPIGYCSELQHLVSRVQPSGSDGRPFYVVLEKILADGEALPKLEGVDGTTGYEWLNVISRVLVKDEGLGRLEVARREFTGDARSFPQVLEEAKRYVLENLLASEFNELARLLSRIAAGSYRSRDYGADRLRAALREFVIQFPVYRTYVRPSGASPSDCATIAVAVKAAREGWHGADDDIFDFLHDVLTLDLIRRERRHYSRERLMHFVSKVQQFTGPMMAKSLEDTAFYRYARLLALNEVGGEPDAAALTIADFHSRMQKRAVTYPHGMIATATHDTKRGEDARARILAVSELADEWAEHVREWRRRNEPHVSFLQGRRAPSLLHEYMIYQTLIGAWPLQDRDRSFCDRVSGYAIKAAREGKVETSWLDPNQAYEAALTSFVDRVLDDGLSAAFIESFERFARRTALLGALNSLTQITLKTTLSGVPDFYQGTELWDLSLVDPDNRRPVDFNARARLLSGLGAFPDWQALAARWQDGRIKLALTERLLAWRNARSSIFVQGDYRPLVVTGPHGEHVVAFARTLGSDAAIVVVARHLASFAEDGRRWLAGRDWQGELTLDGFSTAGSPLHADRRVHTGCMPLSELFSVMPVALFDAKAT